MDDYISRQSAIEEMCKGCNIEFFDEGCEPRDCEIRNRLQNITAADVRENVKGEWIDDPNREFCFRADFKTIKCNKCGYNMPKCDSFANKFCPNCGAQMMRGEA